MNKIPTYVFRHEVIDLTNGNTMYVDIGEHTPKFARENELKRVIAENFSKPLSVVYLGRVRIDD